MWLYDEDCFCTRCETFRNDLSKGYPKIGCLTLLLISAIIVAVVVGFFRQHL